jgi:uncharacterized protein (TIGR00251 family)
VPPTEPTAETTSRRSLRLRVRVAPRSRRAEVVGRIGDAWKLRVRAAPERGRANEEVVDVLAGALRVPPSDVRVVSGHTAREKVVELEGLSLEEAERRLSSGKDAA